MANHRLQLLISSADVYYIVPLAFARLLFIVGPDVSSLHQII